MVLKIEDGMTEIETETETETNRGGMTENGVEIEMIKANMTENGDRITTTAVVVGSSDLIKEL